MNKELQKNEKFIRCAGFITEMIKKYGSEILDEQKDEEDEAKVVRMIFDLFVNTTLGANGVAKKLNDDGIKKIVRQNGKLIVSLVNTPDFAEAVKGLINKEIDVSELTERLTNLQKQLRQLHSRQRHLEQQQDNLDFDSPNFDKMSESITRRLNDTFDEMTRVEGLIREIQTSIQNVEQQKLTQDSIYQFLLMFDKL